MQHACRFYETLEQCFVTAAAYLKEGLEAGERCVFVAGQEGRRLASRALEAHGIEVGRRERDGSLAIFDPEQLYLREGRFDEAVALEAWREEARTARAAGWPSVRVAADMDWATAPELQRKALPRYESALNELEGELSRLCLYHRRCFDDTALGGILCAHPWVTDERSWHPNPFYRPSGGPHPAGTAARLSEMLRRLPITAS